MVLVVYGSNWGGISSNNTNIYIEVVLVVFGSNWDRY